MMFHFNLHHITLILIGYLSNISCSPLPFGLLSSQVSGGNGITFSHVELPVCSTSDSLIYYVSIQFRLENISSLCPGSINILTIEIIYWEIFSTTLFSPLLFLEGVSISVPSPRGVGRLWGDKALDGRAIVCEQWFAPPMLCLLRAFRRPLPYPF